MKLKNIVAVMFICIFFSAQLQAQAVKPEAMIVLQKALKNSVKSKKNVLLTFYAPWSPWSTQLEKVFTDKEAQSILQKYYELPSLTIKSKNLSRAKNYENPGADQLHTQYFTTVDSLNNNPYPLMVFLDNKGTKLYQYNGFPDIYTGVKSFTGILKKTSSITDVEVNTIMDKFSVIYKTVTPPSTEELLKDACKKATLENKKVFVIFSASWCHWCHALEKALQQPICKKFFDNNFVIVPVITNEAEKRILDENYGSAALLHKYQGPNRQGIPFWIIFDKDGKHISDFNGYPLPSDEGYVEFVEILKKTTPVTDQDLNNIKQAFTEIGK